MQCSKQDEGDTLSTRLKRWFEKRRAHKSLEILLDHAKLSYNAAEIFEQLLNLARENGSEKKILARKHNRITHIEKEGDILRRKILQELTRGILPPQDREEFARLARRMDDVLDLIHGSSRILMTILDWFMEIPTDLREIAYAMSRTVVKCAFNLERCLEALSDGDIRDAMAKAELVERIEEQVDDQYNDARSLMMTIPNSVSASLVLLFSHFLEKIENTADRCEDATDQIRVLAVSAF